MYIKQYYVVYNDGGDPDGQFEIMSEDAGPHSYYGSALEVAQRFDPECVRIVSTKLEVKDC